MTIAAVRRLPSLDGWRAVAIAMVVIGHFEYARGFSTPAWWGQVFQSALGVRIFFVISGLLITHILLDEGGRRGDVSLRAFYVRRVLRIFPIYFLYAGVVALLASAGLAHEALSSWIGTLTFTRDVVGRGDSMTVHFWSLAVEEQFYLVWPATLAAVAAWRRPFRAIPLLAAPMIICPILRAGVIPHHRLLGGFSIALYADSLAVGCLGAILCHAYGDGLRRRLASSALLAMAAAVFIGLAVLDDGRFGAAGRALIPAGEAWAVLVMIWITIERRSGLLYRVLNWAPMAWLGTLSYSLYVWHQAFLGHFAGPRLSAYGVYDWRVWWVGALVCACLSYYAVERPILSLRERFRRTGAVNPTPMAS